MKKLKLNKESVSLLEKEEMNNLAGGYAEFFASKFLCNTDYNPGGGCAKSRSCAVTSPVCFPF